jgi:hypothetical protein
MHAFSAAAYAYVSAYFTAIASEKAKPRMACLRCLNHDHDQLFDANAHGVPIHWCRDPLCFVLSL